jgi:hypothetical protein
MKKVPKPSNSVCYTPSSEPFRIKTHVAQIFIVKKINAVHVLN